MSGYPTGFVETLPEPVAGPWRAWEDRKLKKDGRANCWYVSDSRVEGFPSFIGTARQADAVEGILNAVEVVAAMAEEE